MAVKNYRVYQERRRRVASTLGDDGVLILPGAKRVTRNADVDYPFRQESNFLYLTGFTEPDALLIVTGGKNSRSVLFCNPKNVEKEIWTGKRFGPKAALKEFGFDQTFATSEYMSNTIKQIVHHFVPSDGVAYCPKGLAGGIQLREWITGFQRVDFRNSDRLIGEMRLIKDAGEIN